MAARRRIAFGRALLLPILPVTLSGCASVAGSASGSAAAASPAGSGATAGSSFDPFDPAAAAAYCTSKGGMVVNRVATWNTNADPAAQLMLAGRMQLCEFESGPTGQATRISVDLRTLDSTSPTIAAVAYLSKVPPLTPPQPSSNPAQYNCEQQLDGTASFGNTGTVGGWLDASQPVFKVMELCTFADGSAIDEFGIFYYAAGTVRGADLAPILRYQPNGKLPAMFTQVRR
jgi:hypothetical protein